MTNEHTPENIQAKQHMSHAQNLLLKLLGASLVIMSFWVILYCVEHPFFIETKVSETANSMGGMAGMNAGDVPEKMVQALLERLQENPQDKQTAITLADQFMRTKRWQQAVEILSNPALVQLEDMTVFRMLAISHFELKQYEQAASFFSQVLEKDPQDIVSHFNIGILYGHFLDNPAKAEEHLKTVLNSPEANADIKKQAQGALDDMQNHKKTSNRDFKPLDPSAFA